jgi:P27 family predicted phage terminase small subunit
LIAPATGKRKLRREDVPLPQGTVPKPPEELDAAAKREWRRVAPLLHEFGLLTRLDKAVFTAYCEAYSRWRAAEATLREMARCDPVSGALMIKTAAGNTIQNPVLGAVNRARADAVKYASEVGLTPLARQRLQPQPKMRDDDPAAKYLS